jgi:hypothetical protein
MAENLQLVKLTGGSFDMLLAMAPSPPGALRLYKNADDEQWSELYTYFAGRTFNDPEHGTLPVMVYMGRKDEKD